MIDHIVLGVADLDRSAAFYGAALAPLGMTEVFRVPGMVGFGETKPYFFVREQQDGGPVHVALGAPDHATVDGFHAAAVAAGGTDNGAPGLRPYHPTYYGSYVIDPDGNNIETVCHT